MPEYSVPIPTGLDVYWERWVDAYNNEETNTLKDILNDDNKILVYDDDDDDEIDAPVFSPPIKTIMTPFGVLPLTEQCLASSHFKFWVGHSNFKLLDTYYPIIADCIGVESVDIFTPYRFRIAIGKLFADAPVMDTVRKTLLEVVNRNEPKKQR